MKILIIGLGGQISDMVSWYFNSLGHKVYQYRPKKVFIPGVPVRPKKKLGNRFQISDPLKIAEKGTIDYRVPENLENINYDVVVIATPSFLIPSLGKEIGKVLDGKLVINISDRFMGGLELCYEMSRYGYAPKRVICLNTTPLQAYSENYFESKKLYLFKQVISYSQLILDKMLCRDDILNILFPDVPQFIEHKNYFDLAFENVHSILHAVQDIVNLKSGNYQMIKSQNRLYSDATYSNQMICKVNQIVGIRDRISAHYTSKLFRGLGDYDNAAFSTVSVHRKGTARYRNDHIVLNKLPTPLIFNCCGYEDIGWSMVPMEALGMMAGVNTGILSALINEWNDFMKVNYRFTGRRVGELLKYGTRKGLLNDSAELEMRKMII